MKFIDLYSNYEKEFTDLLCKESGKPRAFANSEVIMAKGMMEHHANLEPPVEKYEDAEKIVTTRYVPLGVVGAICPWNFPIILSVGKISPALITGCTIIVKPSPFTPYTALKLIELAQEVFPPGVVQVLGGDDKLGPMLTARKVQARILMFSAHRRVNSIEVPSWWCFYWEFLETTARELGFKVLYAYTSFPR